MRLRGVAALLGCLLCATAAHAQALPPQQFTDLGTCQLESGKTIHPCRIGYRVFGTLDAAKDNAVAFPLWFGGHSGDVGALIGPGPRHFLNTDNTYVIALDPLGNGVSSSPSNSASQHGVAFPAFTIRDMVHAEERVLRETLHLTHVHAIVGQSMGGLQTFEWGVDAPGMMDALVPIVGTPQLSSYDLLFWSTVRQALVTDPGFAGGHYTQNPPLPMVSYLTALNLASPAYRVDHTTREGFAQYFQRLGAEMHLGTDANDYLHQLDAVLGHDIAHGGSIYIAARQLQAPMLIINAQQDHMVNPILPLAFARLIHAKTLVLASDCGHMAPGCEIDKVAPAIAQFLAPGGTR